MFIFIAHNCNQRRKLWRDNIVDMSSDGNNATIGSHYGSLDVVDPMAIKNVSF